MLAVGFLEGIGGKFGSTGFALVSWNLFAVMLSGVVAFFDEKASYWLLVVSTIGIRTAVISSVVFSAIVSHRSFLLLIYSEDLGNSQAVL
jgi:hypothetical protein